MRLASNALLPEVVGRGACMRALRAPTMVAARDSADRGAAGAHEGTSAVSKHVSHAVPGADPPVAMHILLWHRQRSEASRQRSARPTHAPAGSSARQQVWRRAPQLCRLL